MLINRIALVLMDLIFFLTNILFVFFFYAIYKVALANCPYKLQAYLRSFH